MRSISARAAASAGRPGLNAGRAKAGSPAGSGGWPNVRVRVRSLVETATVSGFCAGARPNAAPSSVSGSGWKRLCKPVTAVTNSLTSSCRNSHPPGWVQTPFACSNTCGGWPGNVSSIRFTASD